MDNALYIEYKGKRFNHGDKVIASIRNCKLFEAKIFVSQTNYRFYLCHNNREFIGSIAADQFGYPYSWLFGLSDNGRGQLQISNHEERSTFIMQHNIDIIDPSLSSKLTTFIYNKYSNLGLLFQLKLGIIDNCKSIEDSKEGYVNVVYNNGKKVEIKLGRLLRKLIVKFNEYAKRNSIEAIELSDALIENIHNEWSSYTCILSSEIKKGEELFDGYTAAKYHKKGSLVSCMTNCYTDLQFYKDNPEQINIMIFYFEEQICGRCLLWKDENDKWYHDRVYSSFDWLRPAFREILNEKGFENIHGVVKKCIIKLDKVDQTKYPYFDTFRYMNNGEKFVTNLFEEGCVQR